MDRTSGLGYQIIGGIRQWVNKNLLGGVPGTQIDQVFMNDLQEELVQGIITEAGLVPTAGVQNQVFAALVAMLGQPEFFVFATQNVTVPTWATRARVTLIGAGASGAASGSSGNAGGGGGGAGRFDGIVSGLVGGQVIHVTIGTPGAAVSSGNGINGSISSFGSYITCPGGMQGLGASPYLAGAGGSSSVSGSVSGYAMNLGSANGGGSGPGAGNGGGGNATGSVSGTPNPASAFGAGGGGGVTGGGAGGQAVASVRWIP
jgi:hypothetical protein